MEQLPPGRLESVEVAGNKILLANLAGAIYAVDSNCTHEDADLGAGSTYDHYVICPFHGSEFDLRTGEVQNPPAERPLRVYKVKVENGSIFLEL